MQLHHIGILTDNIEASINSYTDSFEFNKIGEHVYDPKQKCKLCMLENRFGFKVELIEPIENSPVRNLINTRGSGPIHLCYMSSCFDKDCTHLRNKGYIPVGVATSAVLFDGRRIMFFLSPQEEFVEIVEE